MEKTVNHLLVFTLVFSLLFGAIAYLLRNSEHDSLTEDELFFDKCGYININLERLNVTIMPYDGDEIRVAYKNDLPLRFELGDNSLSITEDNRFVVSIFAGKETEFGLYMYVPKQGCREVAVYTGSGNVRMCGINSGKISAITDSGDIVCEDMTSLGNFTTTSGFISLDLEEIVSGTEIYSRKGDAEILFPSESSVSVDFETFGGKCVTDVWNGDPSGSRVYSFNGGSKRIHAVMEDGTLNIN